MMMMMFIYFLIQYKIWCLIPNKVQLFGCCYLKIKPILTKTKVNSKFTISNTSVKDLRSSFPKVKLHLLNIKPDILFLSETCIVTSQCRATCPQQLHMTFKFNMATDLAPILRIDFHVAETKKTRIMTSCICASTQYLSTVPLSFSLSGGGNFNV